MSSITSDNSSTKEFSDSVETDLAIVKIRQDEILEIRFKTDDYEVDVKDQLDIELAVLNLTDFGKKSFHILVVPGPNATITKEAREMEMFTSEAYRTQKSMAVVVIGLAQRIIGTLYFSLKKTKPNFPYKFFNSEAGATLWLKQQIGN